MHTFGYSLEYTLNLSFPIFNYLSKRIADLRKESAVDNSYLPYVAGKYGGNCQKQLIKNCNLVFKMPAQSQKLRSYTPEELEKARKRMEKMRKTHK